MSIHDETWNRSICNYCGDVIHYGEKRKHGLDRCIDYITSFKKYSKQLSSDDSSEKTLQQTKNMNNTCITCGNSFETTFKNRHICSTCVDKLIDMYKRIDKEQNMNTQTLADINQSASEITTLIETLGFVTENRVVDLQLQIGDIIKKNLMGNYSEPPLGIPADDLGHSRFAVSCGCNNKD